MIYGSFVDMKDIAEEAECSVEAAFRVSDTLLRTLHRTALVNGLTGSLQEAALHVSTAAAYHLSGLYGAAGDGDIASYVNENLMRLFPMSEWKPYMDQMDVWESTLTEEQRDIIGIMRGTTV